MHSPIVRHDFVEVLLNFVRNKSRGQGSQLLLDMVFSNPACREALVPSLVHHYIAVGYVEGATEVFDKNNARSSVTSLLMEFWSWPRFRDAMYAVGTSDAQFSDFALAFLSDAVFLFNDSLGRLHDVKLLQLQLDDADAALAANPHSGDRHSRHQQEQSLRQVGRVIFFIFIFISIFLLGNFYFQPHSNCAFACQRSLLLFFCVGGTGGHRFFAASHGMHSVVEGCCGVGRNHAALFSSKPCCENTHRTDVFELS